jgi:hypothetical protein
MRGEGGRSGKYKPQWNGISYFLCKLLRISLSCGKKTAPCTIDKNAESSIATAEAASFRQAQQRERRSPDCYLIFKSALTPETGNPWGRRSAQTKSTSQLNLVRIPIF